MFVDTHCHINMMTKKTFDRHIDHNDLLQAQLIVSQALENNVGTIINVGTSIIENYNCIAIAQKFDCVYATVGIHPNDINDWRADLRQIKQWITSKEKNKIVAIGECGIDRHYPGYDLQKQKDVFKAQIEYALEYDLALVVHSRDAYDETLSVLEEYRHSIKRAVMHCFSYDTSFAKTVIEWSFMIGIGAAVTYPKNETLREVVRQITSKHIVLETDAPFLPLQTMRGKQNHPQYIKDIAAYVSTLCSESVDTIETVTTQNAYTLFQLPEEKPAED